MQTYINKHIFDITPYKPGKPIEEVKREYKLRQVIKLASNENSLGPSPKAVKAMETALNDVNRYPDGDCFYLKTALAKKLKIDVKNLIFGNGSDEILDMVIKTFLNPRQQEIVTSDVTFLEYKITGQIAGAKVVDVPLRNFKYDLDAIKKAINKNTKIIFIANPNNPTGTYVDKAQFDDFLKAIPKEIVVIYDEAYAEFVDDKDYPHGIDYYKENNLIAVKTFSKAYGLAGLRIGYAIANEVFIDAMNRVRQPFNVNSLAQIAASAALKDTEFLSRSRQMVRVGKEFLYKQFDQMKLDYVPSVTNFILVSVKEDVFEPLLKLGIIVRPMDMYGLKGAIRVTVGTEEENNKFINALKRVIK